MTEEERHRLRQMAQAKAAETPPISDRVAREAAAILATGRPRPQPTA